MCVCHLLGIPASASILTPPLPLPLRWPAIVSPDPWSSGGECVCEEREGRIYHIEFLGKPRSHLWLPEDLVKSCFVYALVDVVVVC